MIEVLPTTKWLLLFMCKQRMSVGEWVGVNVGGWVWMEVYGVGVSVGVGVGVFRA